VYIAFLLLLMIAAAIIIIYECNLLADGTSHYLAWLSPLARRCEL